MMSKTTAPKPPSFPALVQQFFTEYLFAQRAVRPPLTPQRLLAVLN